MRLLLAVARQAAVVLVGRRREEAGDRPESFRTESLIMTANRGRLAGRWAVGWLCVMCIRPSLGHWLHHPVAWSSRRRLWKWPPGSSSPRRFSFFDHGGDSFGRNWPFTPRRRGVDRAGIQPPHLRVDAGKLLGRDDLRVSDRDRLAGASGRSARFRPISLFERLGGGVEPVTDDAE